MAALSRGPEPNHRTPPAEQGVEAWSPEHLLHVLVHRKFLILGIFSVVTLATVLISHRLPDIYSSETVILVDPQKVPESYIKPTVSGDVRNRLGTLSQQILSATRLQKIIEEFNLYAKERGTAAREDVIARMRKDITVSIVSDFGGSQDLQAFKVVYRGRDPRLVAEVTNQLASLFIEENLKVREQEATGTTEFFANQLQEARKTLEDQEGKLRDFKLQHIGEMPEQQTADLQILGQIQSQLQLESEALNRAQQQQNYLQSMLAQTDVVVDLGERDVKPAADHAPASAGQPAPDALRARLAQLLTRYTDNHPEVRKLKAEIAQEEAASERKTSPSAPVPAPAATKSTHAVASAPAPVAIPHANPVVESQLRTVEAEITKHKQEQTRLAKLAADYEKKLEAIPVREQQIAGLARDYEMSRAHYSQLLDKELSAETATQLEIRQKGERFEILDAAQPAEKPSSPNRMLINLGGSLAALLLGLGAALGGELFSISIIAPQELAAATNLSVLEVIPVIETAADVARLKLRTRIALVSFSVLALSGCAFLFYFYRTRI